MRKILTMMIATSIVLLADFSKSGDIVTDSVTGLQWQDDAVGSSVGWQGAIDRCEVLSLGGHSDWRLPNKKELLSIVDYSKYNPSINAEFQNTASDYYWSSTTRADDTGYAWVVGFSDGYTSSNHKGNSYYVRCVRAGQ